MKKLILVLFLFTCLFTISVFAWSPNDLTKYPPVMDDNDWILNIGVGVGLIFIDNIFSDETYLPPFRVTLDKNVPIGDKNLPFFFGGFFGYSGYGVRGAYFNHRFPVAARAGYHFNWGVEKLDTYAVTTAGWIINIPTGNYNKRDNLISEDLLFDIKIGGRWFISDSFGFWAEAGFGNTPSLFDIGITLKF